MVEASVQTNVSKKATVNSEARCLRQQMLNHQFEATTQKRIS
jgi:hypothetical protein